MKNPVKSSSQSQRLKCEKLKVIFVNWSQSVTYHCFAKIFKANTHSSVKLVWSLVFFTLLMLTCFILVNIILSYFKYNVVATIKVINEMPSVFPTLTICDTNAFTSSHAQTLIEMHALQIFNKTLSEMTYAEYTRNKDILETRLKASVNAPDFGDENRKLLGFNLSHILYECVFNGIPCDFASDFRWHFNYNYGNCFQFNTGPSLKKQFINGAKYGLSLKLGPLVNYNQYLVDARGIRVFIENKSYTPSYFDTFVSVELSKETSIAVKRVFMERTPEPYSDCQDLKGK